MGKGMNAAGKVVEFKVSDQVRAQANARGEARRQQRGWIARKAEAQEALSATDYLAMPDRRPMTDGEKAYREALRAIVRAEPTGAPPDLPAP